MDPIKFESLMNYDSLLGYEATLRGTVENFDHVYLSGKASKQLGTLKLGLRELLGILDNITKLIEVNNMFVKTMPFEPLQKELEENKSAKKAIEEINDLRKNINGDIEKLQERFFKQTEYCLKLNDNVLAHIPSGKEYDNERQNYESVAREFETIGRHSLMNKGSVPFEQEIMSVTAENEAKPEYEAKKAQIDEAYDLKKEEDISFEQALNALAITLKNPAIYSEKKNVELQREIKKEVAAIEKALPPKVIAISAEALDKLRASDQLQLDLETIKSLITNPSLTDKKYSKYNEKINEITTLLDGALKIESDKSKELQEKRDNISSKMEYAEKAVRTYDEILTNNQGLQQDKIHIRNGEYSLQEENERLESDAKKAVADAHAIESKAERYQEWDDGLKKDELYERARNDRENIKENEATMDEKLAQSAVTTLPPEYVDMKKKLQSMSSLYQMQMVQGQEFGGMSR